MELLSLKAWWWTEFFFSSSGGEWALCMELLNEGAYCMLQGQRALDFVLRNQGLIDKTLLFDIELLKIIPTWFPVNFSCFVAMKSCRNGRGFSFAYHNWVSWGTFTVTMKSCVLVSRIVSEFRGAPLLCHNEILHDRKKGEEQKIQNLRINNLPFMLDWMDQKCD